MVDRKVDALILLSASTWSELDPSRVGSLPLIVLDRVAEPFGASTVISDEYGGARAGVEHLLERGYRRVACVGGPAGSAGADDRVRGWRDALRAAGHDEPDRGLVRAPYTSEGGAHAAARLFEIPARFDAVFVSSDVQSMGFLAECHRRGVAVPADLAFVTFDGTDLSRYAAPPLTAVTQPVLQMAQQAMLRLLERTKDSSAEPTHDVLTPHLVIRESTPRATH